MFLVDEMHKTASLSLNFRALSMPMFKYITCRICRLLLVNTAFKVGDFLPGSIFKTQREKEQGWQSNSESECKMGVALVKTNQGTREIK